MNREDFMNLKLKRSAVIIALLAWLGFCPGLLSAATEPDSSTEETEVVEAQTSPESKAEASTDKWGKFLPLPIFVTEPAIGEGLGAALIYFHRDEKKDGPKATTVREFSKAGKRSKPPPTATGIFGAYTNSDTRAIGIGHSNSFMDDTYRVLGAAAEARINSQFYLADTPLNFKLDGNVLFTNLKRRLGNSNAFLGVTASYVDARINYDTDLPEFEGISLLDFDFVDVGLAASLIYDTRDNTMMPASGYIADLTGWRYDEGIGGDFNYQVVRFKANSYFQFGQKYVLGLRLDMAKANGEVPFYAEPYVDLRGIPALRYQGKTAGAFEVEARRRLGERWAVSVFAGAGTTELGLQESKTLDNINTFGIGLRYLALKEQDAWVGIDIAEGPEDVAWYIQMGNAW